MTRAKAAATAAKKAASAKKTAAVKAAKAAAVVALTADREEVEVKEGNVMEAGDEDVKDETAETGDGEELLNEDEELIEGDEEIIEGDEEIIEGDEEIIEGDEELIEGDEELIEGGEELIEDGEKGKEKVVKEKFPVTEEDKAYIAEVLNMKIKVSDGTEVFMFSYGPLKTGKGTNGMRPFICHWCRMDKMTSAASLKAHLNGRLHISNLKRTANSAEHMKKPFYLFHSHGKQFMINPGENIESITPEYEDRIVDEPKWEFKKITDEKQLKSMSKDRVLEYNKTRPLLGLEYMAKMFFRNHVKIYCCLCDMFVIKPEDMYQHLTRIGHQANYIIKHFPTLYERVVKEVTIENPRTKELAVREIFRKLYRKIEMKHGFKTINIIHGRDFHNMRHRHRYISGIRKIPHYDENTMKFSDAEVNVLIKKTNNNIPFIEPDPTKMTNPRTEAYQAAVIRRLANRPTHNTGIPPHVVERWESYRIAKPQSLERLTTQYKKYEIDPKSHPSYQKEWSQFWHTRCEELKKEMINPDTYNFDKEWLPHWQKCLRKIYNLELNNRKKSLREKFILPTGRRTPSPRTLQRSLPRNKLPMMGGSGRGGDHGGFGPDINPNFMPNMDNIVSNQNSNFSVDDMDVGMGMGGGMQGKMNMPNRQQQQQQQPERQSRKRPHREPVTVISVLRLLSALEDQLGSLGPKSVQLLSKAVVWEKNKQNMNDLLMDNDYYIFFATAKEKLKGQVLARVLDSLKTQAANQAVDDLTYVLASMEKENRSRSTTQNLNQQISGGGGNNAGNYGRGNSYGNDNVVSRTSNASDGGRGGERRFTGNNANNENFGNAGSFCNSNIDGNFGGNNSGIGGQYRSNDNTFGGSNDGGNYRNSSNNGDGNYRGGFNSYDGGNNRWDSNFDDGNYREGSYNNDGGNYRLNNDVGNNYRGGNNDCGDYRDSNDGGNYRGSNSGNYRGSSDGGNYRGSNDLGNSSSGNYGGNAPLSNFRGNNSGNFGGNSYGSSSSVRNTGSGGYNSNLSSGFGSDGGDGANQYRSNLGSSNDNFNKPSNFSGNNNSSQGGNWMGGSGSVYSSLSNKSNTNTPVFTSGLGGFSSQAKSLAFDRNPSSNYNLGSGGNFRRFN